MEQFISIFIFAVLVAFCVAKLEINVEGSSGPWAKNLPTYHFKNIITSFLMGKKIEMTGYHVWLTNTALVLSHAGFFLGLPWTVSLELKLLGVYFTAIVLEDLFYFILNPAYGIGKLNLENAPWHRFIGPIPMLYIVYLFLAIVFISASYLV